MQKAQHPLSKTRVQIGYQARPLFIGSGEEDTLTFMQNWVTYGVFGLICATTVILSSPTGKGRSAASESGGSDGALAALFGGSSRAPAPRERSIFESDFWRTGVSDKPIPDEPGRPPRKEGEPDLLEPTSSGNPINPETNQPYSDAVMEQFSELRKKFPNNSIIPHRKTDQETRAEEQERVTTFALQSKVFQGQASGEEIDKFYDYQSKGIKDRLELLDYVLQEQGNAMSPEIKSQYEKILTMNKNQMQSIEEARTRAKSTARN
jgi:hypothetical protein